MGGHHSKEKQSNIDKQKEKGKEKQTTKDKQTIDDLEPPYFVDLPHHNPDLWPTFKEALSAKITNGKELDVCLLHSFSIPFSLLDTCSYFISISFSKITNGK